LNENQIWKKNIKRQLTSRQPAMRAVSGGNHSSNLKTIEE